MYHYFDFVSKKIDPRCSRGVCARSPREEACRPVNNTASFTLYLYLKHPRRIREDLDSNSSSTSVVSTQGRTSSPSARTRSRAPGLAVTPRSMLKNEPKGYTGSFVCRRVSNNVSSKISQLYYLYCVETSRYLWEWTVSYFRQHTC